MLDTTENRAAAVLTEASTSEPLRPGRLGALASAVRRRVSASGTLFRFSSASVAMNAATMICNIIILRWLAPDTMGLWQSLLLIGTYAGIAQGGVTHGLNRELPFRLGQGSSELVEELAGTARVGALAGSGLCLLSMPFTWLVFSEGAERWGAAAVLFGTAAQIYRQYLIATYKAARAFETLARIHVAEIVATVATLPLVFWFGYYGLAIQFVVLRWGNVLLVHAFRPLRQVGRFSWVRMKELYGTGIPLFAFGYLSDVARSFPRVVLLALGGVTWVGLFAPANAIIGALILIPGSLGIYVYPQMSYRFGRTGDPASLWPMARATLLWSLVVGLPMAVCMIAVAPSLLPALFPAYSASIPAVQWTAVAGVFLGASVAVNALASLKAYKHMFTFVGARMVLLFVLPWLGGRCCGGTTGVAAGMAAAYAVDFVIVLLLVRSATSVPAGFSK